MSTDWLTEDLWRAHVSWLSPPWVGSTEEARQDFDAGRWLDAQETVEQVPAPAAVIEWLQTFVDQHREAEPRLRRRPESFRPLTDRFGNPALISTGKSRG